MKSKLHIVVALLLVSAGGSVSATELAWQQPGYVMEELVVTAPSLERSPNQTTDPALRSRIAQRIRTLTAHSLQLIRGADEFRAHIDLLAVSP